MRSSNRPNQNSFIVEYGARILQLSQEAADAIRPCGEEQGADAVAEQAQEKWFAIFQEFIYFFLHVTGRHITPQMDQVRCWETLNELKDLTIEACVETICRDWPEEMIEKIKSECFDNFAVSMDEYSQCRSISDGTPNASLEKTLLWEFGKTIAGLNDNANPGHIVDVLGIAVRCLKTLKPQEALSKLVC